jgi:hypothetical protein
MLIYNPHFMPPCFPLQFPPLCPQCFTRRYCNIRNYMTFNHIVDNLPVSLHSFQ